MSEKATRLRNQRAERGWTQTQLIAAMMRVAPGLGCALPGIDSLKTNIRRWENERIVPGPDYRRVLRAVYGLTDEDLGFPPPEIAGHPAVATPSALSIEGLDYFATLLAAHVRADNLIGPHQVVHLVEHETRHLSAAARDARGTSRPQVIRTTLQFQEFLGWLQQDSGRLDAAMASTDRARDLAVELDDPLWTAYLLMRKSNIATDAGDPVTAAVLADLALTGVRALPPRVRAVVLRQKATAQAALGDTRACAFAVDQALSAVQRADDVGDDTAGYCTIQFVAMEAAACWTRLHKPAQAINLLDHAEADWPEPLRRDKGLFLARLATAHAAMGDTDRASVIGSQAVGVAGLTRSARTIAELRRLRTQLAPSRHEGDVDSVCSAVASLVATAA